MSTDHHHERVFPTQEQSATMSDPCIKCDRVTVPFSIGKFEAPLSMHKRVAYYVCSHCETSWTTVWIV